MSPEAHIRLAEERDLEAVNSLLRQVLEVHHKGRPDLFRPSGKKYSDSELLVIFKNPSTPVFVYDECGVVLGYVFCSLQKMESGCLMGVTTLYIDDLCVDETARGKHIGLALFEFAKEYAKDKGCHNITLYAWECNPGAKAFYEALGLKTQYTSLEMVL